MNISQAADQRLVVVSAPKGTDPAAVLFSRGVEMREHDVLLFVEKAGNAEVEIHVDSARAVLESTLVRRKASVAALEARISGARMTA